jgi:hypothetical protein
MFGIRSRESIHLFQSFPVSVGFEASARPGLSLVPSHFLKAEVAFLYSLLFIIAMQKMQVN